MWDYIIPAKAGQFDCSEFSAADNKLLRDAFREAASAPIYTAGYSSYTQTRFGSSLH